MSGAAIKTFFDEGGTLMYVNLAVWVVALAIVAERVYVLNFRLGVNARRFLEVIENLVKAGNYDRALKVCATQPNAALPRVVRAALENRTFGHGAVTASIEEALAEITPYITKRSGVLWGVANLATLIGLIGTVFGLIESFKAQALAAPEQKAALLTGGISHAMNNTAWGLTIAVMCILAHILLGQVVKNIMESLEHGSVRVENILARKKIAGDTPATPA